MEFTDFSKEILAALDEDQRFIALEEANSILGLGDSNIAVVAGFWKAQAFQIERKLQQLQAALDNYFKNQNAAQEYDKVRGMLDEAKDVITEKLIASGNKKIEDASRRGKIGANALHSKANGTREKRAAIQAIWASGKYTSRDICADEEWAGLKMSRSTARKALIGQPDPT